METLVITQFMDPTVSPYVWIVLNDPAYGSFWISLYKVLSESPCERILLNNTLYWFFWITLCMVLLPNEAVPVGESYEIFNPYAAKMENIASS